MQAFRMKLGALMFGLLFLGSVFGCASSLTLADYEPKSAEEEAIRKLMMIREDSWNNKDVATYLSCWHDNAIFRLGVDRIQKTKQEYAKIAEDRMNAYPTVRSTEFEVEINGNTATEKTLRTITTVTGRMGVVVETLQLVKEDGRWYIMGSPD